MNHASVIQSLITQHNKKGGEGKGNYFKVTKLAFFVRMPNATEGCVCRLNHECLHSTETYSCLAAFLAKSIFYDSNLPVIRSNLFSNQCTPCAGSTSTWLSSTLIRSYEKWAWVGRQISPTPTSTNSSLSSSPFSSFYLVGPHANLFHGREHETRRLLSGQQGSGGGNGERKAQKEGRRKSII